jgi:hypothetical protein
VFSVGLDGKLAIFKAVIRFSGPSDGLQKITVHSYFLSRASFFYHTSGCVGGALRNVCTKVLPTF